MKKTNSITPFSVFNSFTSYYDLIIRLAKREVIGRYRGSMMGLLWSFFNPLIILTVYTFVFSIVLKVRWGIPSSHNTAQFGIVLFSGLIMFNLFSECINKAPSLILSNVSYVKKVVFPLEILPWVTLMSALFHALVSTFILLLFVFLFDHQLHLTILLFPLVLLPFLLVIIGLTWLLATLGVYLRDVVQAVGIITMVLMFLSPIFYPISTIPEAYRPIFYLNPITIVIQQTRDVIILGVMPNWISWGFYCLVGLTLAWLGLWCFQKGRSGFADVM